ncbi:MAG: ribose transport system permease protein [Kiritimatiellia bacterium]|jgi:ribose transport system permease protein
MQLDLKKAAYDYGMIFVLLLLVIIFSITTNTEQQPDDLGAARKLAKELSGERVLIVTRDSEQHIAFASALEETLKQNGDTVLGILKGEPRDIRVELVELDQGPEDARPTVIAGPHAAMNWDLFNRGYFDTSFPNLQRTSFKAPATYRFPTFLTRQNLLNIATQIVVIAIIAIGMTMVIITGGIDLSVGSLIALSASIAAAIIHNTAGTGPSTEVGTAVVIGACIAGVLASGCFGFFSGAVTAVCKVPSFIVTLAVMMMVRGYAYKSVGGEAKGSLPEAFTRLGHGDVMGIPISVVLMVLLYFVAWFVMTQTIFGRNVYALGGNAEAARLSGIPIKRITIAVFTISGLLAGLGGIILASELASGDPKTGTFYELYVIAAVVVGGTSLMGGQGKILGTLIGAFIIGVIKNGMNLNGIDPFNQMIVFGWIILLAVLAEKGKEMLVKNGAR